MKPSPRWLVVATLLAACVRSAAASPPLDDGAKGMTCYFYSAAARLEWKRAGGDWTDAGGAAYGAKAFATEHVGRGDGRQDVAVDITALARRWAEEQAGVAAIYLREQGGGGIVNFNSRESPDTPSRPRLVIEWSDGKRAELAPQADTYFSCPNHRSYGGEPHFKVGGKHAAILVFPWEARASATVRSATLHLSSGKQYGKGATVGVFRPDLPGQKAARIETGLAQAFERDHGIGSHPDVLYVEGVEERTGFLPWGSLDLELSGKTVTSDTANRFEPLQGSALSVTIEKGNNTGLNSHVRLASYKGGEPEDAYFRYYLRLGDTWNPTVDGGKLPGFSGTYNRGGWGMRKSDGHNGWSARGAFFQQSGGAAGNLRGIGSYVYHAAMQGNSGETWGWGLGPSGLLEKNRWYSVEQHVRLNSPGQSDGVLRAWVDGQLVFERSDIRYRDTPDLKIESVWLNVYHGGIKPAPADMTLFIDNLVIARKYIGPMNRSK